MLDTEALDLAFGLVQALFTGWKVEVGHYFPIENPCGPKKGRRKRLHTLANLEEARLEVDHHVRDKRRALAVEPRDLGDGVTLYIRHHVGTKGGRHVADDFVLVEGDPVVPSIECKSAAQSGRCRRRERRNEDASSRGFHEEWEASGLLRQGGSTGAK